MTTDRLICLPDFPGFYESSLSAVMDYELDSHGAYENEKQTSERYYPETYQPEELRVDVSAFAWEFVDYRAAEKEIAEDYVVAFNEAVEELAGLKLGLRFESMTSPKFYNFETDRLFAFIPERTIRALWLINKRNKFVALRKVIADRHSSRSGFASSYTTDFDHWSNKPLADWDHNELATLLRGALNARDADVGDVTDACVTYIEEASDGTEGYAIRAMDWQKYEARIEEERATLLAEIQAADPDYVAPYRCPETPDMCRGAGA
jgi:hypothetical protein